jgi:heparan-alpha-glucosaminide N-acetyltransferase
MVDAGGATDGTETVVDLRRSLVSHGCRELKQKAEEEGMRILGVDALAAVTSRNNVRKTARLASLDVFRGLSIAVMILVDNAGGVWPSINHSPWNGVTLADFVMPFFLFIVGVALALTYRRIHDKKVATLKAVGRAVKLCILGIILQGGYFHGLNNLTYGIDVQHIRWCGVLQRIAFGFLLVALCEIWAPRGPCHNIPEGTLGICKVYFVH